MAHHSNAEQLPEDPQMNGDSLAASGQSRVDFDRDVFDLPTRDQSLISIDACLVCGNTTAVPRFAIEEMDFRVWWCVNSVG